MRDTLYRLIDNIIVKYFNIINNTNVRIARFAKKNAFFKANSEIPVDLRGYHARPHNPFQCSFRVEIISHSKSWLQEPANPAYPECALDNKLNAYKFMKKINIRTPNVLFTQKSSSEIHIMPGTVLKPEAGYLSNGVFIISERGVAREISTRREFSTADELKDRMQYLLKEGKVEEDSWYCETQILNAEGAIAPDVKFYSFYGETPLVLKVDRNGISTAYETMDQDGCHVDTGYYKSNFLKHITVTEDMYAKASQISLKTPSPFLRLDFLLGEELVFGEIGNMVGGNAVFSNFWDRRLGDAFARARGRLYEDLRSGKSFDEYDEFLSGR